MSQTELTLLIAGLTVAWFGVAGLGFFLFMRWRKRDLGGPR